MDVHAAFVTFLASHPEIDDEIRDFQDRHRDRFRTGGGEEFKLSQTESHKTFCNLVDRHLAEFCEEAGIERAVTRVSVVSRLSWATQISGYSRSFYETIS